MDPEASLLFTVPGQPELYSETLSQKREKRNNLVVCWNPPECITSLTVVISNCTLCVQNQQENLALQDLLGSREHI